MMQCPACGRNNWKLLSAIHAEGKTHRKSITIKLVDWEKFTSTVGTENTKSGFSVLASPPQLVCVMKMTFLLGIASLFLIPASIYENAWLGIPLFICLFGIYKTLPIEHRKYKAIKQEWEITRMCMHCGTLFLPSGRIVNSSKSLCHWTEWQEAIANFIGKMVKKLK